MSKLKIYTDGSCLKNPGAGGYGVVFTINGKVYETLKGGKFKTTNNEMELNAILQTLEFIANNNLNRLFGKDIKEINILSDSAYCINSINQKWIHRWRMSDWNKKDGYPIKNKKLWIKIWKMIHDEAILSQGKLIFSKVKGHSGDEFNELADELARDEALIYKGEIL